ncbi:hypothetical protein GM921_00815 [Pedobacter sp. LMG 31464]|uniref:Uncharacterized protein n=1 Tax=Pedobacter planticolens TaxID=2679964 RepID=A0A923IVF9_9SPHI|nr:hypothetical protein [Pedobacter planticolens]MBB2144012.1 hypothetical protein [Pedobacter planticolens]
MKNKKAVYLLIGCVTIVWGLIIYRIYSSLATDEEPILPKYQPKLNGITVVDHTEDKHELHLQRDPFSSYNFIATVYNETSPQPAKTTKPIVAKPIIQWPTISYRGYINNRKSRQKITIISINAKELMITEGSKHQGIQLLKNMGDSIKILFNHETKYISIK